MEALNNYQTMVCDLTGMPSGNASMLDEATAAAEAMTLARRSVKSKSNVFVVAGDCHPQTIEVIQTRAQPLGIIVLLANSAAEWHAALQGAYFAVLAQYPSTRGRNAGLRADVGVAHSQPAAFLASAERLARVHDHGHGAHDEPFVSRVRPSDRGVDYPRLRGLNPPGWRARRRGPA